MKKYFSPLFKIFLALLFFQSPWLNAQTSFQLTTQDLINQYPLKVCPLVPLLGGFRQQPTGQKIPDPACVAFNNDQLSKRADAQQAANNAGRLLNSSGSDVVRPTPPPAANCDPASNSYNSCVQSYQAQVDDYNHQLTIYNQVQAGRATEAQNSDKKILDAEAQISNGTATGTLNEIQAKNQKGNLVYTAAKVATLGAAVGYIAYANGCAASCPWGCCAAAAGFFALGAAFIVYSDQAKKQAAQHQSSALEACQSYNQISSTQKDCAAETTPPTVGSISYDLTTGQCLPAGSAGCQAVPTISPPPPGFKNTAGVSGFANSGAKDPSQFLLPDGSVKLPNGKVYKPSDFGSVQSLIAAGLSPSQAQSTFGAISAANGSLGKNGLNSKDLLKDANKKSDAGFGITAGGGAAGSVTLDANAAGGVGYKENLSASAKDAAGLNGQDREPSSEGLVKDFNGEQIGAEGEDIFKMMNRRYKLKSDQDSFISSEAGK